jgi:hypothetical protein
MDLKIAQTMWYHYPTVSIWERCGFVRRHRWSFELRKTATHCLNHAAPSLAVKLVEDAYEIDDETLNLFGRIVHRRGLRDNYEVTGSDQDF